MIFDILFKRITKISLIFKTNMKVRYNCEHYTKYIKVYFTIFITSINKTTMK
jgi:hypothetical protein